MMKPKSIQIIAAFTIFGGGSSAVAGQCDGSIITAEGVVGFSGCISAEVADAFVKAINDQPALVVIQSSGGDVSAAIKMAWAIAASKRPVIIRSICFSSCANYLMPAAISLLVERNSVVGFHGDARLTVERMSDGDKADLAMMTAINAIAEQEADFSSAHAKVALVHGLQSVASAKAGSNVVVKIEGATIKCVGQGLLPWFPALRLLKDLGLIDRIVDYDQKVLPQMPWVTSDFATKIPTSSNSPLLGCKPQ